MRRFVLPVMVSAALAGACGGRTPLLLGGPSGEADAAVSDGSPPYDAFHPLLDSPSPALDGPGPDLDAPIGFDIGAPAVPCEDDQNTESPPADCGGPSDVWFAWPYTPGRPIDVSRIELHTTGGGLALLTSKNGLPGEVLFQGTMPPSPTATWIGVDVSPPVALDAGALYYLAEEVSECSQALGGTQLIEYYASTLAGPWGTTGTGSYTSHVIGTCQ